MKPTTALSAFATAMAGRRRWLLLALLATLHLVLLLGPADPLARMLFVGHLGLVILWQPIVRGEQEINLPAMAAIGALAVLAALGLDWWPVGLWIALLAGVVGGKVFIAGGRWPKLFHLLALGYLAAALLLLVVPQVVPGALQSASPAVVLGGAGLPALFVVMALLPAGEKAEGEVEVIDFVYSLFIFLLLAVLVLGSLAPMLLTGRGYAEALLETLLAMGAVLLLLGWLWNPHAGFGGIGAMFARYVLSVGLPMERWLHTLADLAQRQDEPEAFVAEACHEMARRLPWVTGGDWTAGGASGSFGVAAGRRSEFLHEGLAIGIYSRDSLSPSLLWHFKLLAQLVGEFYADKRRARELKQLSYLRAVHETGARLTHDVKNLLQSLRGLCAVAGNQAGEPAGEMRPEFVALLRRQLPAISQRLEQTLEKLRVPRLEEGDYRPVADWWNEFRRRYAAEAVEFAFTIEGEVDAVRLPAAVFSNVAENLLENAFAKRRLAGRLSIAVRLKVVAEAASLEVCDDGEALPEHIAADLLRGPVPSENGLGIGLYQAARLAEMSGYALVLADNRPGLVCFRLRPVTPPG